MCCVLYKSFRLLVLLHAHDVCLALRRFFPTFLATSLS